MWEKKVLTHCDDVKYGQYETLREAKQACEKDSNCAAIYDHSCSSNDDEGFYLCPLGYTEKESSAGSCLYIESAGTVIIQIIKINILQRYVSPCNAISFFLLQKAIQLSEQRPKPRLQL